jgi:hypothetical protein
MNSAFKILPLIFYFWSFNTSSFAACADAEKAEVINYVPTVVTGAASLAVSGLGFVADGAIFVAGNLLTLGVICGLPTAGLAGFDAQLGSHAFNACSDIVLHSNHTNYFYTNIGQYTFVETKSWRCPMFVD